MTGGSRVLGSLIVGIASVTMLTGCVAAQIPEAGGASSPPTTAAPTTPETTKPADKPTTKPTAKPTEKPTAGYDGWDSFERCGHEYGVDWQWIDGFPAGEMEDNGLMPACGELWLASRGSNESLLSVRVDDVPANKIDGFGDSLAESGYTLDYDSFAPDLPPDEGFYGVRIYYLGGDTGADATGIAIEVYGEDVHNDEFQIYVDFFSPETRKHP